MTTTHKTLCGPRGALILSTDPDIAKKIDMGVFPGEQGGPHIQSILAKAVAFGIAATEDFRELQRGIKKNAAYLAEALVKRGLKLAYNGTDSHLFLIDLNTQRGEQNAPLRGEVASRILDLCDITLNKNTIAGDTNAAHPSGIRIGATWITQRGFKEAELDRLARLIHKVLTNIKPFHYIGSGLELGRGKIDFEIMEEVKAEVRALLRGTTPPYPEKHPAYPFYSMRGSAYASAVESEITRAGARAGGIDGVTAACAFGDEKAETAALKSGCGLVDFTQAPVLEVTGERAAHFLQNVATCDVATMEPGTVRNAFMLNASGRVISGLLLFRDDRDASGFDRFLISLHTLDGRSAVSWLRGLSDGYITFDTGDVYKKVDGPVVIRELRRAVDVKDQRVRLLLLGPGAKDVLSQVLPEAGGLENGRFTSVDCGGTTLTVARSERLFGTGGYEIQMHPLQAPGMWSHILKEGKKKVCAVGLAALKKIAENRGFVIGADGAPDAAGLAEANPSLFDLKKPFFIGRGELPASRPLKEHSWKREEGPLKKTPLNSVHRSLAKKDFLIPFAGWEMPVWYTRVSEEHNAVRTSAGLFDVAHMGVMEVAGPGATRFLDLCTTGYVMRMKTGQALYSYILDPDGKVLDDVMIYRRGRDRYQIVCNAVNAEKNLAWFGAVNSGEILISRENPGARIERPVKIRDLKDPSSGDDRRIDLALQGPASLETLLSLAEDIETKRKLLRQPRSFFVEIELAGVNVIASRTGYTGEEIAYELYVHPDNAVALWEAVLDAGGPLGVAPVGLGARDSTRCEAGLPLYGHELAGDYDIDPIEAGYGSFVKFHKPFFIGREALLKRWIEPRKKQIVRFRVTTKMPRTVKKGDVVVDRAGKYIGNVTSCALVKGKQVGMALVDSSSARINTRVAVFPLPPGKAPPPVAMDAVARGDKLVVSERAKVISRFPMR